MYKRLPGIMKQNITSMPDYPNQFLKPVAIILDDHKLFADSFATTLEGTFLFDKIWVFNKEEELITFLVKLRNSRRVFLFLDYYLEQQFIIRVLNHLKRIRPGAYIIIVSSITNPVQIRSLIEFAPDGIISKADGIKEILDCLNVIKGNGKYASPHIQRIINSLPEETDLIPLTNREIEIVRHFARGLTVDATAAELNLSRHTVAAHRRKIFGKLKVKNIAELLAYARKTELI